jgi:hypothetical protein
VTSTDFLCSEILPEEALADLCLTCHGSGWDGTEQRGPCLDCQGDGFPSPCPCCGSDTCRPRPPLPLREEAGTLAVETCEPMPEFGFSGEWEAFSLYVTRYSDGAEFWEALDSEGRLTWEGERKPDAQSIIDALVMASAPDVLPQECP